VGIDERGWRALETLAREINARSPEAAAREVSKRAVEVAKAAGIFALDRLVSRLAGRRVDTAPRALPTDGTWVRRAIVGGPASPEAPRARASERPAPSPVRVVAADNPSPPAEHPVGGTDTARAAEDTSSDAPPAVAGAAETPPQVAVEPMIAEPMASEPVAVEPMVVEPVAAEPMVVEPAAAEPMVVEPAAAEPMAAEPITAEPMVIEPVAAAEPVAVEPVAAAEPVAAEPVAEPAPSLRPTDAPADLQVPRTDEPLPALPARYGIDRVVMLAAESEWVFVYWETAPARLGRTNRAELRLLTEAGALVGRAYVDPVQGRQHLRVPARGQRYTAELVLLDGTVLSRSRPVLVRAPEST
jgi:hypothetical protein